MNEAVTHWSVEAEQSLLGCALLDAESLPEIPENAFFDSRHRAIWRAIRLLASQQRAVDAVTVLEELKAAGQDEAVGYEYLAALSVAVPSPRGMPAYAAIVREKHASRELMRALDEAMAAAQGTQSLEAKLDRVGSILAGLQTVATNRLPKRMYEVAVARTQHYEDLAEGRVAPGWPTHFPTLDTMLNGGFRPGALVIVAARPGVGKSSFSQWVGIQLARQGLPTLFLSQEMPAEEVADRAFVMMGRVKYGALASGKLDTDSWSRAAEFLDQVHGIPLYVDDQPALTLADIKAKARAIKGLKVLIVDYLQLCAGEGDNRNSEIEKISRGLKALAKELGCVVIALSQLNRQVENRTSKVPTLSDLRDSGSIEQDADVVVMLWPHSERVVGLGIAKNRQGRLGQVPMHFDGDLQRWGESTESLSAPQAPARRYAPEL